MSRWGPHHVFLRAISQKCHVGMHTHVCAQVMRDLDVFHPVCFPGQGPFRERVNYGSERVARISKRYKDTVRVADADGSQVCAPGAPGVHVRDSMGRLATPATFVNDCLDEWETFRIGLMHRTADVYRAWDDGTERKPESHAEQMTQMRRAARTAAWTRSCTPRSRAWWSFRWSCVCPVPSVSAACQR